MHTFKIVGESDGWAIQLGGAMTTPCKSQATAIRQAQRMAAALRRHGEVVSVVVELAGAHDPAEGPSSPASRAAATAARKHTSRRDLRAT